MKQTCESRWADTGPPNLYYAAVAHDTDEVGRLNGAQPVGDDKHSATPCGPVQSLLHHALWFCI